MLVNPYFVGQSRFLDLQFDSEPIVDNTGRHTLSHPSGVTVSSGQGQFDGGSTSYITVDGTQSDFDWSANFYVVGMFTPSSLTGFRALWDTHGGGGYTSAQRIGIFTSPLGEINVYTGGAVIAFSPVGVLQVGVTTEVAVFRNGTRCYIEANGTRVLDFELTTVFNNASRKMYVGGSEYSASQFSGSIDDFRVLDYM